MPKDTKDILPFDPEQAKSGASEDQVGNRIQKQRDETVLKMPVIRDDKEPSATGGFKQTADAIQGGIDTTATAITETVETATAVGKAIIKIVDATAKGAAAVAGGAAGIIVGTANTLRETYKEYAKKAA